MSESVAVRVVKLKLEVKERDECIAQLEEALRILYKAVEHMDFSYEMGEGNKVEAVAKARAALSREPSEAPEKEGE